MNRHVSRDSDYWPLPWLTDDDMDRSDILHYAIIGAYNIESRWTWNIRLYKSGTPTFVSNCNLQFDLDSVLREYELSWFVYQVVDR